MTGDEQLIYDYVYTNGRITTSEGLMLLAPHKPRSHAIPIGAMLSIMVKNGILSKKDQCYILAPKKQEKIDQPKMF